MRSIRADGTAGTGAAELLRAAAVLAIDGKLSKLSVQIGGICRAEIATGRNGEIKVRRVEGRTLRAEE